MSKLTVCTFSQVQLHFDSEVSADAMQSGQVTHDRISTVAGLAKPCGIKKLVLKPFCTSTRSPGDPRRGTVCSSTTCRVRVLHNGTYRMRTW